MAAKKKEDVTLTIPKIRRQTLEVVVIGDFAVMNRPTEDAKMKIRAKQQQWAKKARGARNPRREYDQATYMFPDGSLGFPAIWFKKSMIEACRYIDGMTMAGTKGAIFVQYAADDPMGALVHVEGVRTCIEDVVRLASGVMDLRYRPYISPWRVELKINFNANMMSKEQVLNLLQHAGFHVGVGDWRPQGKSSTGTGQYGVFWISSGAADEKEFRAKLKAAQARVAKYGDFPAEYITPPKTEDEEPEKKAA